jgi:hypothetical protein
MPQRRPWDHFGAKGSAIAAPLGEGKNNTMNSTFLLDGLG